MGKFRVSIIFLILTVLVIGCTSESKTLKLTPKSLDFEGVYLGDVSDLQVTLKNKYGKVVYIYKIELSGSPDYSFVSGPYAPITLVANEEIVIDIRYEPTTAGVADAMLSIDHDASSKLKEMTITGEGVPAARIDVSEQSLDFRKVYVSRSRTLDIEVTNVGTDDLSVNTISFSGVGAGYYQVSAGNAPFTLIPNAKHTVTVEFTPPSAGSFPASMDLDHNAVNVSQPFSIPLSGEGVITDPEIKFSEVSPWNTGKTSTVAPSTHDLILISDGLDPLTVTDAAFVTGTFYKILSIKDKNGNAVPLPQTLQPGDTLTLNFEFTPTAEQLYGDTINIVHDGINVISPYSFEIESQGKVPTVKTFNMKGSIENWTVPANVTNLTIEVWGAQGARTGGKGAYMKGDFTVNPGDSLKILVGQKGFDGANGYTFQGGGGGGGSFVCTSNNTPLIIAGGGGGWTSTGFYTTMDGRSTTDGGDTLNNGGGNNGQGGQSGISNAPAAGGGGLLTDGGAGTSCTGGKSFLNGGAGGTGGGYSTGGGNGGFGGGGGGYTNNYNRSGGGGGYSGGQGGTWDGQYSGGGGGSYNNGTNQTNTSAVNSGDGKIVISYVD